MAKMIVTYRQPADVDAFMRHYHEVHVPLARQLPGLVSYEVSKGAVTGRAAGDAPFLVGVLTFDSMAGMRAAFESQVGLACAADRRILAPCEDDSTMLLFDTEML